MISAPKPDDEAQRIETLNEYDILDTLPEQEFDDLTEIAAAICGTNIALVSLVDRDRQWFKSKVGLDAEETHRDLAFCAHAILQKEVFVVEDASKDERFFDNPLVTQAPDIRFYAGVALRAYNGQPMGTLCVIDQQSQAFSDEKAKALQALGRQVESQLELRRHIDQLRATQGQLQKANLELQRFSQSRTQFLNHVSHELRTPLNAILGFSRILNEQMPVTDDSAQDSPENYMNLIRVSAESLSDIVNHVLDISRLEAGKMSLDETDVILRELLDDIININHRRAVEKEIQLSLNIDENVADCFSLDKTKLMQIVMNLIGNAIKFTPAGNSVTLQATQHGLKLMLEVIDTGVGIETDDLESIFQPFKQVKNQESDKYVGSGLGLTIC
ncbi:MAG: ATP-binding protein, partial [Kangiellaceae bacterium]|nr:ATP-binding protein [Kangiellaceae bacterium]